MANTQTTFPTRPQKKAQVEQQIWTVWSMLQYFANSVFDTFVTTVVTPFIAKFANGTATITTGNATVVVTHNIGTASYSVAISPTVDPVGRYWITAKTTSTFTITLSAPAGSNISFDWMVKAT